MFSDVFKRYRKRPIPWNGLKNKSTVRWQILKRVLKKRKHAEFSEKRLFLIPDTHTFVQEPGDKKWSFFGKSYMLFVTSVLSFALLPYHWRVSYTLLPLPRELLKHGEKQQWNFRKTFCSFTLLKPLSPNPKKWSNTLKQFVGKKKIT